MSAGLIVPREVVAAMRAESCSNCRFMHKDTDGDLVCRRNPPNAFLTAEPMPPPHYGQVGFKVRAAFPVVRIDQWCGAWGAK